jgi:hypothetical protein
MKEYTIHIHDEQQYHAELHTQTFDYQVFPNFLDD